MKLYRPANGTEGDLFMEHFCYRCVYEDENNGCPIRMLTFITEKEEENYPNQWRYDENDKPRCIAFTQRLSDL